MLNLTIQWINRNLQSLTWKSKNSDLKIQKPKFSQFLGFLKNLKSLGFLKWVRTTLELREYLQAFVRLTWLIYILWGWGSLEDSAPFFRRVAVSNPALAATYGPRASAPLANLKPNLSAIGDYSRVVDKKKATFGFVSGKLSSDNLWTSFSPLWTSKQISEITRARMRGTSLFLWTFIAYDGTIYGTWPPNENKRLM